MKKYLLLATYLLLISILAEAQEKGDTLVYNDVKIYKGKVFKMTNRATPYSFVYRLCGFGTGFASQLFSGTEITVMEIKTKPRISLKVKSVDCKFYVYLPGAIDFKEIE